MKCVMLYGVFITVTYEGNIEEQQFYNSMAEYYTVPHTGYTIVVSTRKATNHPDLKSISWDFPSRNIMLKDS